MRTPHIPGMDQVRDEFIEAWAGDFVRGEIAAAQYFDQALSGHNLAVEAAAEQRGEIKALREAAESLDIIDHMYKHFDSHPSQAPAAVRAAATYLHSRADQKEDDNE